MLIRTNQGLGDCLYLRPVLRWLPHNNLYLETPWPQVFQDMPKIQMVRAKHLHLRTQRDNVMRGYNWADNKAEPDITLGFYDLRQYSITGYYCDTILGMQPSWFDNSMTLKTEWVDQAKRLLERAGGRKIALIRPNTLRAEWPCPARNPKTEYLQRFIDMYKDEFYIISLANLAQHEEWYDGELKGVDWEITTGVPAEVVMGMFSSVNIVVTSPSFWVAMGLALNTNMVVVYGAHEPHYAINDRRLPQQNCTVVEPTPFDLCSKDNPKAYKSINIKALDAAYLETVLRC